MASGEDRLKLRPITAALQRLALYETVQSLYIVGATYDGSSCRLLKIDRSFPYSPSSSSASSSSSSPLPPSNSSSPQLKIQDDGVEYSEKEIKKVLIMLDQGNVNAAARNRQHGMKRIAAAFGIMGFIRFLEGYYVILITKRKPVATIGGHVIYKVEDTMMYPVSNPPSRPLHPDEGKYLKVFQNVDLSSNFYFSYSYDLTHSLQCQMRNHSAPPHLKFVWNSHLINSFEDQVHKKWIIHVMHGFVGHYHISVYGRPIYLTMIARRSKEYAGTRFLKRGANDEGHVANEVETEQILHDATSAIHNNGRYTAFTQHRGSVPSFWSQDLSGMRPKPQITIDRATPFASPSALHFMACLKRFGSPIICLNLVKKRERRARESLLSVELQASITYLNQFLPPEHHIQYIHKDMARINRSKTLNLIEILEKIADGAVKATGFFHSGSERYCNKLNPHPDYAEVGGYGYKEGYIGRDQTGVLRVNCVDCLDRTNTAQFMAGKCALGYQLYALGLLSEPQLPFDCETIRILEEAYEDLGDTLAVQYGGSQLVHRVQTYRKVAPMANHGRDLLQTIQRYYRNAFTDTEKQMAINVFLGIFQPREGQPNIWELPTDYYLHHTQARLIPSPHRTRSHTKWWSDKLLATLPLPQAQSLGDDPDTENEEGEEEEEEEEREDKEDAARKTQPFSPRASLQMQQISFDEVYKPSELTDFDGLFSRNMIRTADHDMNEASPFIVNNAKPKRKLPKKSLRRAIVGSPSPTTAVDPDSPSSGDSSDEEESQASQPSVSTQSHLSSTGSPHPSDVTTMEAYGFELREPLPSDMRLYQRYANLHSVMCMPPVGVRREEEFTSKAVNKELARWEPTYDYGTDSVFAITPPVVSEADERIYQLSEQVARMGPHLPPNASVELYSQYARKTWR